MMARSKMKALSLEEQIMIPSHAVLERENGKYVFIEKQGKAISKKVILGNVSGDNVQVRSGLMIGDRLVVSSHQFLSNNQKIKVIKISKQYAKK